MSFSLSLLEAKNKNTLRLLIRLFTEIFFDEGRWRKKGAKWKAAKRSGKTTSKLFKHLPSLNLIVTQSTQNVELFVFNELQALEYLSCTRSHYLQVLAIFLRFVAIREQGWAGRAETKISCFRRVGGCAVDK